uniref:FLYWCH-type domain-containing protein n=1 Tax=Ascaris lumbricoides TaxID=6252 RepID=A0A0M3HJQ1_ASCLU
MEKNTVAQKREDGKYCAQLCLNLIDEPRKKGIHNHVEQEWKSCGLLHGRSISAHWKL